MGSFDLWHGLSYLYAVGMHMRTHASICPSLCLRRLVLSPAQGITAKREIWFWSSGQEEKALKKECRNPGLLPVALRKAVHFGRRMFRLPKLGSLNPLLFDVVKSERALLPGCKAVNLLSIQSSELKPVFLHPAPYFGRKSTVSPKPRGL